MRYSDLTDREKRVLEAAEKAAASTVGMTAEEFQIFRNDVTAHLPELAPAILAMAEDRRREQNGCTENTGH
ncbi:MAG: hypothetical protein Q4B22_10430 [Eubacteriales bacterium]|nr:hypothetical protein [Eubacteriales bacterium]